MPGTHLSPPFTKVGTVTDPVSLDEALPNATSTLDVLEMCQQAISPGADWLWMAGSVHPSPATYVVGDRPVPDSEIQAIIEHMEDGLSGENVGSSRSLARSFVARWLKPTESPARVAMSRYHQVPLMAAGKCYGVLRATLACPRSVRECSREVVEGILTSAMPYVILTLQKERSLMLLDPLTGLWTPDELQIRVDVEVERAQVYPVEFSLVMMEMRMSPGRTTGALTDKELRAVGEVLRDTLRASDSASRLPDGRFALLLPMTNQRSAFIAISRLTDHLREHPDLSDSLECGTGVSGWAFEGADRDELFRQAATALENAKSAGARGAFVFL